MGIMVILEEMVEEDTLLEVVVAEAVVEEEVMQ